METGVDRLLLYISQEHDAGLEAFLVARGWRVLRASTAAEARRIKLPEVPMVGLVDLHSGYADEELAEFEPLFTQNSIGWVGATIGGQPLTPQCRQLLGVYFLDYFTAPRAPEFVAHTLGHAFGMAALRPREPEVVLGTSNQAGMIGRCEPMQRLFSTIQKIARSDAPVLITGESGTGKELAAQAIHNASDRAGHPFQAVNCAAIPATLMLSELFGYEKGAFTGAMRRKPGRVEQANGGTFFLDEIGDMPLESQTSLLRFLQTGRIERLGGDSSVPVDVRIISATHVDLDEAILTGQFRSDLFHRLCVLRVHQPPLRARGQDIVLLAKYVLKQAQQDAPRRVKGFSPAAIQAICSYDWPGNVRELINRIRRAVVMVEGSLINPEDLDLLPQAEHRVQTLDEVRGAAERLAIEQALVRHQQRLSDTAKELGISRVTLYRLMRGHGMKVLSEDIKVS